MAKISIVNSFDVREEEKLSAETFRPEYLEVISKLKELTDTIYFGELISKIVNGDEIRTFVKKGLPYIRVSDMDKFFVKTKDMVKIPKNSKIKKNIQLSVGDILISRSGTIGIVAIATSEIKNAIISSHIIRIALKQINHLNPYYVCAFLNSRYGQLQILQKSYGGVVPEISQEGLKRLLIYRSSKDFQLHIEQLVKHAYKKRKLAEQKYQQAEKLLYELLGINKEEIERLEVEKAYETNFKEVKQAFRFDAEYYHPKFNVIKLLKEKEVELLNLWEDLIISIETGKNLENSENYRGKGIRFIKNENLQDIYISGKEYYLPPCINVSKNKLTRLNDIIISRVGSIGNCSIITEETTKAYYSDNVYRIRVSNEIEPWFLVFYLRSYLGQSQFLKLAKGSNQPLISHATLKQILIPKISKSDQQKIASLIREYFKLRKEARQLVQRAIREVEEAIENASRSNGE